MVTSATAAAGIATVKERHKIRRGRPRPSWIINTMRDAWEELGKAHHPDIPQLPLIDPQEEYEWENERQNEVIALYAAVRADIFGKSAGQRWYLRENISNLERVFKQLDEMEA